MWKKVIGRLLIAIVVLLVVAGYRSFIDDLPYWQGFDKVVMTALGDFWQLLTSPIVLTALVILLVVYFGRVLLFAVLATLEEVRAGTFSAKFNQTALAELLRRLLPRSGDRARPAALQTAPAAQQEIQNLVSRMDPRLCRFLVDLSSEPMTIEDLVENLAQAVGLAPLGSAPAARNARFLAAAGFLSGIASLLMGPIFSIEAVTGPANEPIPRLRIVVLPDVKRLLEQRLRENPTAS